MIRIIRPELDLDSLRWGELPVTDLRHVKNEIYKHRRALEKIRTYRKRCSEYQRKWKEKSKKQ